MAELIIKRMSDIQPEPVEWLWQPYIPRGRIVLLQGDGSMGKTTISMAIAAAVTRGESLPGEYGGGLSAPASVIIQNAEDSYSQTIRPRLEHFGADCDKIYVIDDDEEALSFSDERIEQTIIKTNARLFIADPVQGFFRNANMNNAGSVRPLMKNLSKIAERHDCTILLVGHLNKKCGNSAYRGLGSIDIFAAARSVLTVGKAGVDDNVRVMINNKNNLAPAGKPQSFIFDPVHGFSWTGEYDISVDEVMNGAKSAKPENQSEKAKRLIQNALRNGAVLADEMLRIAIENSVSEKTFRRVKSELGVISIKRGDDWYWDFPIDVIYTEFSEATQHGQGGQNFRNSNNLFLPVLTDFNYANESEAV